MKNVLLFFIFIFFTYCSIKENDFAKDNEKYVKIHKSDTIYADNYQLIKESEFETTYVPLETMDESLIGEISRLIIENDTIIIFDRLNNSILLFDINGRFLRKLGEQGKGPQQYGKIECITYNQENSSILLFDNLNLKIIEYHLKGTFINSYDLAAYPSDISFLNGNLLLYMNKSKFFNDGNQNYFDLIFVRDNKVKSGNFKFEEDNMIWYAHSSYFYYLDNDLHYIDFWNGNVYKIIDYNNIQLKYHINISDLIPHQFTKNATIFDENSANFSYISSFVLESDNHIHFDILNHNVNIISLIYDKNSKKLFRLSNNAKYFEENWSPSYVYNNIFIDEYSPMFLKQVLGANLIKNNQLIKIAEETKFDDNPILVFHKIIKIN